MPRALLVAGNSKRFLDEARMFETFLRQEVGLTDIQIIETAYLDDNEFVQKLTDFFVQNTDDKPTMLLYSGHGNMYGWALNDTQMLIYETLAALLKLLECTPLLLINLCCHSFAAALCFEKAGVSPERVSIIAACDEKNIAYRRLAEEIIDAWGSGVPFTPFVALPEARLGLVARGREFLGYIASYRASVTSLIKRIIMVLLLKPNRHHNHERILNFWEYVGSKILYWITLGHRGTIMMRICVGEVTPPRPIFIEAGKRFSGVPNAKRWGQALDHNFFPPLK